MSWRPEYLTRLAESEQRTLTRLRRETEETEPRHVQPPAGGSGGGGGSTILDAQVTALNAEAGAGAAQFKAKLVKEDGTLGTDEFNVHILASTADTIVINPKLDDGAGAKFAPGIRVGTPIWVVQCAAGGAARPEGYWMIGTSGALTCFRGTGGNP